MFCGKKALQKSSMLYFRQCFAEENRKKHCAGMKMCIYLLMNLKE